MPAGDPFVALSTADRWLLACIVTICAVLIAGTVARRLARSHAASRPTPGHRPRRKLRRSAGVVVVLGPLIGLATSPASAQLAWIAALGALVLAGAGTLADRSSQGDRLVIAAIGIAAVSAVAGGVRLGPTGIEALDLAAAFAVIVLVTAAANGLGNIDGLSAGTGAAGALGVFALAGFAGQPSIAGVAAGLGAACLAFLAFNVPPASLFIGPGGRLAIGYVLAVGTLSASLPIGPTGRVLVPCMLLGLFLLDAALVLSDRLRRQHALLRSRRDHLVHRLMERGWSPGEATVILVVAQLLLTVLSVFTGRGVLSPWVGALGALLLLVVVGVAAKRTALEHRSPLGPSRRTRIVVGAVVVALVAAIVPTGLAAADVRSLMEEGRREAARALAAARNGEDAAAELAFRRAAGSFARAQDRLASPLLDLGLAIPVLASNLRAARTLADIGRDLARAGTNVTLAVDQDRIEVADGRLPLDEVRRITPALEDGARALDDALVRLSALEAPYLLSIVRDSLREITRQLTQAAGEARRAAAAARLAPAIFGGNEPRTYLLIVQNNAELRATGGLISNWGLLTAVDGDVSVGELFEPAVWNERVAADPTASRGAPADFEALFPFRPAFAMQDANLSPHFPAAARTLTNLAPSVGLPPLDGVVAVDPLGLAALLELTGPVRVPGWPTEISAATVADVTLRDQYQAFEDQTERGDFLGDVAKTVIDEATSGSLGAPARIAQVLGAAAHEGHLTLHFTRPDEQHLAEVLDVANDLRPTRSDALGVYTQNAAPSKIDYYLDRRVEYRVQVDPGPGRRRATVRAELTLRLENTAPDAGLPRIVIGPFDEQYTAGVNRSLVSVYSPLTVTGTTVDGVETPVRGGPDAGRIAYSLTVDIPAKSTRTVEVTLEGRVRLEPGGWYEVDLGHQPTIEPDRVQLSVSAGSGWQVTAAPGLARTLDDRAVGVVLLERPRRFRVQLAPSPAPLDLWARLEQGT